VTCFELSTAGGIKYAFSWLGRGRAQRSCQVKPTGIFLLNRALVQPQTTPRRGGRVLVVEDNEHLRSIIASILHVLGYSIIVAENGAEAIEKAISAKPDIILLDLDLPDMTGHSVARTIRKNRLSAHIPIIGCSAYSTGDETDKALRAGMVDYLQKPISSDRFKETLERFISRSK